MLFFMSRRIIFILAAVLLIFGAADAQKRQRTKLAASKPQAVKKIIYIQDKDEYAVYEAVLKAKFQNNVGQTIVLNREVTGCSTIIDRETENQFSRDTLEQLFSDCSAKKNGNFELLGNFLQTEQKIVLVPESELEKIFIPTCDAGWRRFYKKFPNSAGNASFSRVGFDSGRNFAVVNFGNQSACSVSKGEIVFLQRENDVWKVRKSVPTWAS